MAAPFSHRAFARKNAKLKTKSPRPVLGWEGGEVLGEGDQNSGNFMRGPRGYLARISAKFRKLFSLVFNADLATARGRARRTCGSFLPPNSNAGGNRAKDRQTRLDRISLDSLTP